MIQTEIEKKAVKNFAKFLIDNYKLDELEFTSTELLDACVEFFNNSPKKIVLFDKTFSETFLKFKINRLQRIKKYDCAMKSLKWVSNQIPDNLGDSNEEKMLTAIKRYADAGLCVMNELRTFIDFYEVEIIYMVEQFLDVGFSSKLNCQKIEPEDLISLATKLGIDAFSEVEVAK